MIVAVVFVDRGPRDDYNSFYETAKEKRGNNDADSSDDGWERSRKQVKTDAPAAPAAPAVDDSNFADLPLDDHLKNAAQPVAMTAAPAAAANPMQGRSPEEIARSVMGQSGISPATSPSTIPGLAVPSGIATPPPGAAQAQPTQRRQPATYLPLQSNDPTAAANDGVSNAPAYGGPFPGGQGTGLTGLPGLGANSTNSADGWNAVSARSTPDGMIGVRSAPSSSQQGMMISRSGTEGGADAPAGFSYSVTTHEPASIAPPGGLDAPLLLPPQPSGGSNKWELPPAPTLPPPPIRDPDRPRSEADPKSFDAETPDSLNPDGSSGQALALSDIEAEQPEAEPEEEKLAAEVNHRGLTAEQALKLAEVQFVLNDEILTEDQRDAEAKKAAEAWADVVAAAELARSSNVKVGVPEVEQYAGMRPDFDPAAWQAAMAEKGFSPEEIRQHLMEMALSEKLVELDFTADTEEDEIRKAYEKTPSRFATPRQVHLQEIYKDRPDDDDRAAKVAESMRRLQRQAASGTDFGLLARQASQSANRQKGGDLGWITPSEAKDELRDKAIADLEPGQVSQVIEEPDGYRIYKLVDVKEARDDFEGGKEQVIAELKKPVRKDILTEARKKLEAGEPLVKEVIKTAKSGPASGKSDLEAAKPAVAKDAAVGESDEDAARREKAREVLAQAAARRRESEKQQQQQQSAGPVTVTQQPSASNQLLYPPGTQVQQMAGGQPASPYQPGGIHPAPPVHSPLTAPESVSVNYSPGETMRVGGNNFDAAAMQASAQAFAAKPEQAFAAGAGQPPPLVDAGTIPPTGVPPATLQQTPEISHSNGWSVSKTSRRSGQVAGTGVQPNEAGLMAPQAEAVAAGTQLVVPPGFEGNQESPPGDMIQPAGDERENGKGGLMSNVKSFFGGFRR